MNAAPRTRARSASSSSRFIPSPFARPKSPDAKFERDPSDMATELLHNVIGGLARVLPLSIRDQQILFHVLYGRSAALAGKKLGLRETTVHKHLHRIYARTNTESRRELLRLGRSLGGDLDLLAAA